MTQSVTPQLPAECKHVVYVPSPEWGAEDLHMVKEQIHQPDGTTKPNLRLMYGFQRPFWITKKGERDYVQPKEWISKTRVTEFKSTQGNLLQNASRALGTRPAQTMRQLQESPYIFGTDIKSTALIKGMYRRKYPAAESLSTVSYMDIETDIDNNNESIFCLTTIFGNQVHTFVQEAKVLEYGPNWRELLDKLTVQFLKEDIEHYKLEFHVQTYKTHEQLLRSYAAVIHEQKPDFVSIWNLDFEITTFTSIAEREGLDLGDIFSDPAVPPQYRMFRYKKGKEQKVTAAGKISPIPFHARWHTVFTPASFYFIDAMGTYKQTRVGEQEESSYSLDAIMHKEVKRRKLTFKEAEHVEDVKARWHSFMQNKYFLHYVVYNIFDVLGMRILEDKLLDVSLTFPKATEYSDFEDMPSQPRRAWDRFHWFTADNGRVEGCTSKAIQDPYHNKVLGLKNWIVTLPASQITDEGAKCLVEDPSTSTNIYCYVGDLDVSSSYPIGGIVLNSSKETTRKEILYIDGIHEETYRYQNMQLLGGHTNALEYCITMFNYPNLGQLREQLLKEHAPADLPTLTHTQATP